MYGIQGIRPEVRESIYQNTQHSVQESLERVLETVKDRNHAFIQRASNYPLPGNVLNIIDNFLFGI